MNIVAYCRVSTNKEDQLNSMDTQKRFFEEFAEKNHHNLLHIFADEGISGTKIKNRKEFNELLKTAKEGTFEMVVVKDISRLARNAVDFLQSIRYLKSLGIACNFVNASLTSQDSEMILGTLALVAQEESFNISKRIKFSKHLNAQKGRVPNLIYGYDKTPGEYFHLHINSDEAETVRFIFAQYADNGLSIGAIVQELNRRFLLTKRGCHWSQNAVSRILHNPIYVGQVINGKQEIKDFLTGMRTNKPPEKWIVTERKELRIIEDQTFQKTQKLLAKRAEEYRVDRKRMDEKYLFSRLLVCQCCGWSYRRIKRNQKNGELVRWVCSKRNLHGVESCSNAVTLDEKDLQRSLCEYFSRFLTDQKGMAKKIISQLKRLLCQSEEVSEPSLKKHLQRIQSAKKKQILLYENDVITMDELKDRVYELNQELIQIEEKIADKNQGIYESSVLLDKAGNFLKNLACTPFEELLSHQMLKQLIEKIEVGGDGSLHIIFNVLNE